MALTALNHFKDLQHAIKPTTPLSQVQDLFSLGLPIFICDAVISAYARKPSLISQSDLDTYFTSTELFRPDFSKDVLDEILTKWLTVPPGGQEKEGEENGVNQNGGAGNSGNISTKGGLNSDRHLSYQTTTPVEDRRDSTMHDHTRVNGDSYQGTGRHGNPTSRTTIDGIIDLEETVNAEERVTHDSLSKCTTILCCWLGEVSHLPSSGLRELTPFRRFNESLLESPVVSHAFCAIR